MIREQTTPRFLNYNFYFAVQILYDSETGQSRGSGYVIMNTVEEAELPVKMFHRMVSILGKW